MEDDIEYIGNIIAHEQAIKLDSKNKRLVSLLMVNARLAYSTISRNVGLSRSNILRRIAILEQKGLITGFNTFINVSKLGINACLLLIQTKCTEKQKEEYIKKAAALPWIYGIDELTGKYNFLIAFYYMDSHHKEYLIEQLLIPDHTKDFIFFNIETLFPILDYTSELFAPSTGINLKGRDSSYTNLFGRKKEQKIIDSVDLKILGILSGNCRASLTDIGNKLKISRETVNYRIKKLIICRAIAKFQPTVNPFLLGFEGYLLLIKLGRPTQKDQIIKYLKNTERCNTILKSEGYYDIISFIHFKSNKEFRDFENNMLTIFTDAIYEYTFELLKHQEKLDWFPKEVEKHLIKEFDKPKTINHWT